MVNLILATKMTGADIFICIFLLLIAGGSMLVACYGIYSVISRVVNLAKARKNQRLMFNQLKKGNYVWEILGEEINEYEVINVSHYFDIDNICKNVVLSLQDVSSSWRTRQIVLPVEDSRTFKYHDYYTIYNEANVVCTAIKKKRDEQRNAAYKVSDEKLVSEVNEVIKRLETIKKEYK
jgi:hypothetical protein